jgi:hypothetical protein
MNPPFVVRLPHQAAEMGSIHCKAIIDVGAVPDRNGTGAM